MSDLGVPIDPSDWASIQLSTVVLDDGRLQIHQLQHANPASQWRKLTVCRTCGSPLAIGHFTRAETPLWPLGRWTCQNGHIVVTIPDSYRVQDPLTGEAFIAYEASVAAAPTDRLTVGKAMRLIDSAARVAQGSAPSRVLAAELRTSPDAFRALLPSGKPKRADWYRVATIVIAAVAALFAAAQATFAGIALIQSWSPQEIFVVIEEVRELPPMPLPRYLDRIGPEMPVDAGADVHVLPSSTDT